MFWLDDITRMSLLNLILYAWCWKSWFRSTVESNERLWNWHLLFHRKKQNII